MTRLQFNFLTFIEKHNGKELTQRDIASAMGISLGSVNKFISFFLEEKLISVVNKEFRITKKGLTSLEPHRVKNAIILAAGFSERLAPVTVNTPKPLVTVNGVRIIDTIIDALVAQEIKDIYVVVGYKKEQFKCLTEKYPFITLIDNPLYNEASNIASLYAAKEFLGNTYIVEADLFIKNPNIFSKYVYATSYRGIYEEKTDDWCFTLKNKRIMKTSIGGSNVYRMIGISYWTDTDCKQLTKDIETIFISPGGKENFWDKIPLTYFKKHYMVYLEEICENDVIEIDNLKELILLDNKYLFI